MSTTSTVQRATNDRNVGPKDTQAPTTDILLHRLCKNCMKLVERSQNLAQMETRGSPIFRLCTFAHLLIYHPTCHLCTFLFATLKRSGKRYENSREDLNVYIQFDHDKETVKIGVTETMSAQRFEDGYAAGFDLKKYSRKCFDHESSFIVQLINLCRLRRRCFRAARSSDKCTADCSRKSRKSKELAAGMLV